MDRLVLKNNDNLRIGYFVPSAYQVVDYLQSDGTQYIDTGILLSKYLESNVEWSLEAAYMGSETTVFFGVAEADPKYQLVYISSTKIRNDWGGYRNYNITISANQFYKMGVKNGSFSVNGSSYDIPVLSINDQSILLFGRKTNVGLAIPAMSMRIRNHYIYSDSIKRYFVPCYRKSDNKPGMYEIYEGVFYTNLGNGSDFTVGPNSTAIEVLNVFRKNITESLQSLLISNCPLINSLDAMASIYNNEEGGVANNQLNHFYLQWASVQQKDSTVLMMLRSIAQDKAVDGTTRVFHGMKLADGTNDDTIAPIIDGDLQITTGIYQSALDALGVIASETEDYGEGLKRAFAHHFRDLRVIYDPNKMFIEFADPEVLRICLANWDTNQDGGISTEEAVAVTTLSNYFLNNTLIETFNELKYFTGIKILGGGQTRAAHFTGCTNLTEISIPESVNSIDRGWYPPNIEKISIPSIEWLLGVTFNAVSTDAHYWKNSISQLYVNGIVPTEIVIPPTITSIKAGTFKDCGQFTSIVGLDHVTSIGAVAFCGCTGLTNIQFGDNPITISTYAFANVGSTDAVWKIPAGSTLGSYSFRAIKADTVYIGDGTSIGSDCFSNATCRKVIVGSNCILLNASHNFYIFAYISSHKLIVFGAGLQNLELQNALTRGLTNIRLLFRDNTVVALGSNTFQYSTVAQFTGIYVKNNLVDSYKAATNWSTFATKIFGYYESDTVPTAHSTIDFCLVGGEDFYRWNGTSWELVA